MNAPGDKPHDGQMFNHQQFLFGRERPNCRRMGYLRTSIIRWFVLCAACCFGRDERNIWRQTYNLPKPGVFFISRIFALLAGVRRTKAWVAYRTRTRSGFRDGYCRSRYS